MRKIQEWAIVVCILCTSITHCIAGSGNKNLLKTWYAQKEIHGVDTVPYPGDYQIVLKTKGVFLTYSSPENYHQGNWSKPNDSTIVLGLKALETFHICTLTDSILVLERQGNDAATIIFTNKK